MKKVLLMISAVALVMGSSCKKDNTQSQEQNQEEQVQPQEQALTPSQINIKAGEEFMAKCHADPEVIFTESGLGYKVIEEGQGAKPTATSVVSVHYEGRAIDGSIFDASEGEPVEFPLNGVIPGFSEGIQLMSPGATYEFYMPSNLAYGPRGAAPVIGPDQTLIFKVRLIDFK